MRTLIVVPDSSQLPRYQPALRSMVIHQDFEPRHLRQLPDYLIDVRGAQAEANTVQRQTG
jgi:hypothetical protein